jgi:hypothetical protein
MMHGQQNIKLNHDAYENYKTGNNDYNGTEVLAV